jgi:phage shock protein PspC (stress-responsive transcriptional regulator)
MKTQKLYRFPKKGYIGGVCYGLGEHTGVDPIIWRILSVIGGFWAVYLILWVLVKKSE